MLFCGDFLGCRLQYLDEPPGGGGEVSVVSIDHPDAAGDREVLHAEFTFGASFSKAAQAVGTRWRADSGPVPMRK